jgi:hypothetical protein
LFDYLIQYINQFAVVVSVLSSLATILSKVLIRGVGQLQKKEQRLLSTGSKDARAGGSDVSSPEGGSAVRWRTTDSARSPHSIARWHVNIRLKEARTARTKEHSSAKVLHFLSRFLTFAQVVVGGVLATSFVQQSLSSRTVGIFGVLVLLASLVKQQYHPEIDAGEASQKASKLEALIRFSEDELTSIDARSSKGEDRTDALINLRDRISRGITEIENPEAIVPQLPHRDLSLAQPDQPPSESKPTQTTLEKTH